MKLNIDYYGILEVDRNSTEKEIKKAYYKLSFTHHPDKGGDANEFDKITEAYNILMDSASRTEFDIKSKWGSSYDESSEMLDFEFNNNAKSWDKDKLDDFKKKEGLNIVEYIDDSFNGTIEYERWVICKDCKGNGKDTKSKIEIKNEKGEVVKMFEGSDGCDFCEGSGKNWDGAECFYCAGSGKVGWTDCKTCNGDKRILGKQKLGNIKMPKDVKEFEIKAMGNFSTTPGKVGNLWLVRKEDK